MKPMNNMRKLGKITLGLAFAVGIIGSASAQMQAVNSAEYSLFSNSLDELISAKEQIDKAAVNPKTAQLPKMFVIKSMVYSRLILLAIIISFYCHCTIIWILPQLVY